VSLRHFRWCLGQASEISAQAARAEPARRRFRSQRHWPPQWPAARSTSIGLQVLLSPTFKKCSLWKISIALVSLQLLDSESLTFKMALYDAIWLCPGELEGPGLCEPGRGLESRRVRADI
jgi:hypothetical protein